MTRAVDYQVAITRLHGNWLARFSSCRPAFRRVNIKLVIATPITASIKNEFVPRYMAIESSTQKH